MNNQLTSAEVLMDINLFLQLVNFADRVLPANAQGRINRALAAVAPVVTSPWFVDFVAHMVNVFAGTNPTPEQVQREAAVYLAGGAVVS